MEIQVAPWRQARGGGLARGGSGRRKPAEPVVRAGERRGVDAAGLVARGHARLEHERSAAKQDHGEPHRQSAHLSRPATRESLSEESREAVALRALPAPAHLRAVVSLL